MMALPGFSQRRHQLQQRLARVAHVSPRALVRRRLERELAELIRAELVAESTARPAPVPEWPEEPGHELSWWQK